MKKQMKKESNSRGRHGAIPPQFQKKSSQPSTTGNTSSAVQTKIVGGKPKSGSVTATVVRKGGY